MSSIDYANHIPFEVIKEDWNSYELKDNGLLRTKLILVRISQLGEPDVNKPYLSYKTTNLVDVIPVKNKLGVPTTKKYTAGELNATIEENDIPFTTKNEDWNVYKLSDEKKVLIKLTLVSAARTNKYDDAGEPIYLVNTQPLTKIV